MKPYTKLVHAYITIYTFDTVYHGFFWYQDTPVSLDNLVSPSLWPVVERERLWGATVLLIFHMH
jgi:hypothetical protein